MGMNKRGNSYRFRLCKNGVNHSMTWRIPAGLTDRQAYKEARKQYEAFEKNVIAGIDTRKMTFKQLGDRFIEDRKTELKPKTVLSYKESLNKINKHIGSIEVRELKRCTIRDFIKEMEKPYTIVSKDGTVREKTLSPTTIGDYVRTISAVLSYGCEQDILVDNVCIGKGIKKPRKKNERVKVITEDVIRLYANRIMQEDIPLKHRAFFFLALTTGARKGELLGLSWENVDFDNNSITISENSQTAEDGSVIFVEPKTSASKRYIKVNATVMQMLKELKREQSLQYFEFGQYWKRNPDNVNEQYCENHNKCKNQCKGYCSKNCKMFKPTDRVFQQKNGIPMHPQTPNQFLRKLENEDNFPHITVHELRHTAISKFIKDGNAITEIASFVGHANVQVTNTVYAHDIREQNKAKEISTDMLTELGIAKAN